MILTAPSKTFLAGEYAALNGDTAIVVATAPRFRLEVVQGTGRVAGIDERSPAGRYLAEHRRVFAAHDVSFRDPHRGAGGFGASTAQFLLCRTAQQLLRTGECCGFDERRIASLLAEYRSFAWNGTGPAPSGADVVAQWSGGIVEYEGRSQRVVRHGWPFADLAMQLIATGSKVATHAHLTGLRAPNTEALGRCARQAGKALGCGDREGLVAAIEASGRELARLDLVAPTTRRLLEQLRAMDGIVACKGCGALGADVVLVLTTEPATGLLGGRTPSCTVSGDADLAHGLDCQG